MDGLIRSRIALELALVLSQRPHGARMAELARAVGAPLSSAQAGLNVLVRDGLAEPFGERRPRYRSRTAHPAHAAVVELAARGGGADRAIEVVLRGNPAVEFAGRDRRGYLVVKSARADAADGAALDRILALIRRGREHDLAVTMYEHDELLDLLRDDPAPRTRARAAEIVAGAVARSFPDRARHGSPSARRLGRAHPSLARVSHRALAALARTNRLRRIDLFGSAVRADFRPDSDVDVLIEPEPDARLSFLDVTRIEGQLEELFDRDVDVVVSLDGVEPSIRGRIERELVTLHG